MQQKLNEHFIFLLSGGTQNCFPACPSPPSPVHPWQIGAADMALQGHTFCFSAAGFIACSAIVLLCSSGKWNMLYESSQNQNKAGQRTRTEAKTSVCEPCALCEHDQKNTLLAKWFCLLNIQNTKEFWLSSQEWRTKKTWMEIEQMAQIFTNIYIFNSLYRFYLLV